MSAFAQVPDGSAGTPPQDWRAPEHVEGRRRETVHRRILLS